MQCCRAPQWYFIWDKLRREHPDWKIDGLAAGEEDADFLARKLASDQEVRFPGEELPSYKIVLLPLVNRGYLRMKQLAAGLPGRKQMVDYDGRLTPVSRLRILSSVLRPLHQPTTDFIDYSHSFPVPPLGCRALILETGYAPLTRRTEPLLKSLSLPETELVRTGDRGFLASWKAARTQDFDTAVVYFSGAGDRRLSRLIPVLARIRRILVIDEQGYAFAAGPARLVGMLVRRLFMGGNRPPLDPRVLLFQTESPPYVSAVLQKLGATHLFPGARILLVCREEDRDQLLDLPGVRQVVTYRKGQSLSSLVGLRRQLREFNPYVKVGVFTGRPIFRPAKLLYFLSPGRRSFAFNGSLEGYWLTPLTLPRLFRRDPVTPTHPIGLRIVLFQTEVAGYIKAAVERLRQPNLFPRARIMVVCREGETTSFAKLPGVVEVVPFPPSRSLRSLWLLRRRIRGFGADLRCAVLTGRPYFRGPKLLYLLSGLRRGFVLNASLDGYWLTLRTLLRPFRRERLLPGIGPDDTVRPRMLLIESDGLDLMKRAIATALEPHVASRPRLTVFCHVDRAQEYLETPGVEQVLTYSKGSLTEDMKSVWRALRLRAEIVAAVFSGRRIFIGHKLLFWFIPSRNRLAFNRAGDCFYVTWRNFSSLMQRRGTSPAQSLLEQFLRPPVKALLFLPRFAYLKIWVAVNRRLGG